MDKYLSKIKAGINVVLDRIRTTQQVIPFPVVAAILLLLAAVEIIFIVMTLRLGILPGQYLALIIVILLAIDAGIIALIGNSKGGKKRYYTGLIASVLLMILLVPGAYFLNDANSALAKLTREGQQFEKYLVIASKDGSYDSVSAIKGEKVYVLRTRDKMSIEARERLVTKADVELDTSDADLISLGNRIYDEKGVSRNNLIQVSASQYDLICEAIKGFKKGTKVIYTQKIRKRSDTNSAKVDVTKDSFNIYVTGIDAWGDIDNVSRSDVNMVVTVNPQTREILLTSIPRDAYVPLHSFGQLDKLTHSGIYGVDETLKTVEDWLDIDLNYYVKINFSMVVKIINAIGGIRVYSDYEFDSAIAKYHYPKGWVTLHGKSALYFARERKSFKDADEQRVKNQQKVMEAIIKKVSSSKVILRSYPELLEIVSENMTTNLSDHDLAALARMQLSDMDTKWKIKTISIDTDDASRGTYSMGMDRELFVAIPREKSVEAAQEAIHDVMYPAAEEDAPKTEMEQLIKDQVEQQEDEQTEEEK